MIFASLTRNQNQETKSPPNSLHRPLQLSPGVSCRKHTQINSYGNKGRTDVLEKGKNLPEKRITQASLSCKLTPIDVDAWFAMDCRGLLRLRNYM
ncbi:unnamed protein product [Brassica oleracea var. botrytis]|uniref:Uncharacterized protein n=2 Tax=Brassica TaxID=3705 RepID=A0A3P6CRT3_BRAOL|nr:unnamed protein product [Brassica napus]VDD12901.1 unnamed protein product [Brassica oleracea]